MTIKNIIFILIFVINSMRCKSQLDTIFFSVTGDTVLYSLTAVGHGKSDSVENVFTVVYFNPKDTLKIISKFNIPAANVLNPLRHIPIDTIKKYHLAYDGIRHDNPDKNIVLKVFQKRTKQIGKSNSPNENTYSTDILFILKCKSKVIRKETIEHRFTGFDKQDFDSQKFCKIIFWKKAGLDKYFIWYSLTRDRNITDLNRWTRDIISYYDYY